MARYPRLIKALSEGRVTGSGKPDPRNRSVRNHATDERSVSMPRELWQALLSVEPFAKETYTPEGERIVEAFRRIRAQVGS